MADDSTSSNEGRTIATKGTRHLAYFIHPDMCLPKGKKTAVAYSNYVESTQLKAGKTETALIAEQPVWTSVGELGPDSEPHHAGVDKGLYSKTYCAEAKALSYSKDVNFEGNKVVRTDDLTSQNHENTVGRVLERPLDKTLAQFLLALRTGPKPWRKDILIRKRGKVWVIVDKKNKVMVLLGTQEYSGTGATQAYADTATAQINSTWSGTMTLNGDTYEVKSMITGSVRNAGAAPLPGANQIEVVQTTDPLSVTSHTKHPSSQPYYGNGTGHQHSTDDDGGYLVSAHEFGHSMGVLDEYKEGPPNPDGTRGASIPTTPPGSIMGDTSAGSKPRNDNYVGLVTGAGSGMYHPPPPPPPPGGGK